MNPTRRAAPLAIACAAAAVLAGDTPLAGQLAGRGSVATAWILLVLLAAGGAGLAWLAMRSRGLARRAARAEARLRRSARAARDLADAALVLPRAPGGGARAAFERACAQALEAAEAGAAAAAATKRALRRGLGIGATARLEALEARATAVEGELAALEARLAGVRDELAETTRCLEGVAGALEALCASADRPGAGRVWCDDLRTRIAEVRKALEHARTDLGKGQTLDALRAGRRLRGRLGDLRHMLEARRASLIWLEGVPREAERLAEEASRMARLGHRGLPVVQVEAIVEEAKAAICALQAGDPRKTATIQARLRSQLEGLRRAIIGREERRRSTMRRIEAARTGLTLLAGAIAALPGGAVRRRFAPASWAAAARLEDRLVAREREIEMALRQAAQANHLDAQAFEEAEAAIAHAEHALAAGHEDVARCAATWRAPAEEEARLLSRLARLHGEVGAAYARARSLGLAPGPGIEGLLVAARAALRQEPIDLAAVARPLAEAERVLAAFHEHLDAAAREASNAGRWRAGSVVIVPPESRRPSDLEAASDKRSERE